MNYCGECKYMVCEGADGFGYCTTGTRNGLECYCGDEACLSFEEDMDKKIIDNI